jgi:rSAM/selenodomain-associated transferase 2
VNLSIGIGHGARLPRGIEQSKNELAAPPGKAIVRLMLSVVIPTFNAGRVLGPALRALRASGGGLIGEIVIADGGSTDATLTVAREQGATVVNAAKGRGQQLAAGAAEAKGDWLLFLHADTCLRAGWEQTAQAFMGDPGNRNRAGAFRFALDDASPGARRLESLVAWRCRRLGLPYGDQGLLLSRDFYRRLGGFRPLPIMEDVDLVRRIGRRRLALFEVAALTSAEKWRAAGWRLRSARNLGCLALYFLGVPPRVIAKVYD